MGDKIWQFLVACVMMALLVAGSIFHVDWALTTVQIIYWVLYPLAFLVLIGAFFIYTDPQQSEKLKKAFKKPITWGVIRTVITVGLMVYAGLIALPVVIIIWFILYFIIRKSILEEKA